MKRRMVSLLSTSVMLLSMVSGLALMPSAQETDQVSLLKSSSLVWFDSTKGITADGSGKISKWADQSGKGHDAVQADANFQPVLKSGAINNVPSLVFENSVKGDAQYKTGQFLEFSGVDLNNLYGTQVTTVVISKPNMDMPTVRTPGYANLNGGTVLHFNETGSWGSAFMGVYSDKVSLRYGTGSGNRPVRGWEYSRPESESGYTYTYGWKYGSQEAIYVNGEKITATDDNLKFYYGTSVDNGVGVINNSRTSTVVDKTDTTGRIGKGYYVDNQGTLLAGAALDGVYYDGEVSEVIVFNKALSNEEIAALNSYIENKYKIASQVKPEATIPAPAKAMAWYDAGKGVTADANGVVTAWADQSGNGHNATATGAAAPQKVDQAVNGKNALRFNGTSNYLTFTGVDINQATNAQLSMVVVSKAAMNAPVGSPDDGRATQTANLLAIADKSGWSGTTFNIYQNKLSARFGYGPYTTATGTTKDYAYQRGWVYTPTNNEALNSFSYAYAVKNARKEYVYLNGSKIDENLLYYRGSDTPRMPSDALSAETTPGNGATVARLLGNDTQAWIGKGNGTTSFYGGDIAEIIIYNKALNDGEIKQLNAYLAKKYALPVPQEQENVNAPSATPFKDMMAWFDAADGVTADATGKVSKWADKSGNGHNAGQNVDLFKPVLKTDSDTGLRSLVFENSVKSDKLVSDTKTSKVGQFLEFYNADLNEKDARLTTVIVSKGTADFPATASPTNPGVAFNLGTPLFFNESGGWGSVFMGTYKNAVTLRYGSGDSKFGTRGWYYTRPEDAGALTFTYGVKDTVSETIYVDGKKVGGDNLRLYYNNNSTELNSSAEEAAENSKISAAVANTETFATIGRGRVNNSYRDYAYFEGEISEIMIFNKALTEAELADLTSYLNHKYKGEEAKEADICSSDIITTKWAEPKLPQKVSVVNYENYTATDMAVVWDEIDAQSYGKVGTFTVEGTIEGYSQKAVATVTVIQPDERDVYGSVPTGAMAWYSASYGGLTQKNDQLYWADRSGNKKDALVYQPENAPTYLPAGKENPFGSFKFDGLDDFLMLSDFDFNRDNAEFTVVAVTKPEENMPTNIEDNIEQHVNLQVPLAFDESMPWGQMYLGTFKDKVTMRFGVGSDGSVDDLDVRGWIYDRATPTSGFTHTIGVKDGDKESIFVDGVKAADAVLYSLYGTTSAKTRAISSLGWIGKGKSPNKAGSSYFKGDIAEIIIYDRVLSATETKNLNDYLNYKYLNVEPKVDDGSSNPTNPSNPSNPTQPSNGGESPATGEPVALPLAVAGLTFTAAAVVMRKSRRMKSK